ncbi:MAG: YkgJ family cysteine cluster protein [Anaerolineae bacterium]|nr:YkgJ family cysteine cluster protein [Anaerolineae bacterium]
MPPLITDLETIAAQAARQRDDTLAFGYYIDIMWDREGRADTELDALVDAIAASVTPHINCTSCANCCRSLPVGLIPDDIAPLADALHVPPKQVIARYVDHRAGPRWKEWATFAGSPCPMLAGSRCAVYAGRPQACRAYPALTPDFRWLIDDILRGVDRCPIIFNVIERLKVRLDWQRE